MTTFLADVRFALRLFSQNRGFAAAAISILALGIGATVSVFSVFQSAVLSPLSFPEPDRLVSIAAVHQSGRSGAGYLDFTDWRDLNSVFEDMAIASGRSVDITGLGTAADVTAERLAAGAATAGFFEMLHVQPIVGRFFLPDEDRPSGEPVVVVSHGFWQRRLGASPAVIGQTLTLNGRKHTIIGVLPASFRFPEPVTRELWLPLADASPDRGQHQYTPLARLKPGATIAAARANLSTIARRLEAEYPATNAGWGVTVPLRHRLLAFWTQAALASASCRGGGACRPPARTDRACAGRRQAAPVAAGAAAAR